MLCDYVLECRHSLSLGFAWRAQNKGVSPARKIVSVARSKGGLVTRYRPRLLNGK